MGPPRNRIGFFALAGLVLAGCATNDLPKAAKTSVTPRQRADDAYWVENGFIHEPSGRVLILRGLNYANDHKFPDAKTGLFLPPWESKKDFETMASWGFNSVRLLVTWEAIEPLRGQYDEAYLDAVAERMDWAQAAGQWVIVDMHQDIYSRAFGGDGAPAWAVLTDGIPFQFQEPWWLNFAAPAPLRAIDNFFSNRNGILDSFVEAWSHLAQRLRDHPALIGYDLLNEPFPGSSPFDISEADGKIFTPFYRKLIARLSEVDNRHLFFVEPNAVRTNVLSGAFPTEVGPFPEADGRWVVSPHLYDPIVTSGGAYDENPARIDMAARGFAVEAARLDAALWVGEWSVWDGHVEGFHAFLDHQLAAMDRLMAGWSFWNYSLNPGDRTSPTQSPEFLDELARPQLSAAAGQPKEILCTNERCTFAYREYRNASKPTEIWIPVQWGADTSVDIQPVRPFERIAGVGGMTIVSISPTSQPSTSEPETVRVAITRMPQP